MAAGGQDWILAATTELIGHAATHSFGGADVFSLENLSGQPAELKTHIALNPGSATKPHDIREIDTTSTSTAKNKAVSNALAKGWEDHKNDGTIHLPAGLIAIWSGTITNIPSGWALCDGGGSRPNLLDKFLKCVPNGTTNPGTTGGAATHTHGVGSYAGPSHTHSFTGTHTHSFYAVISNAGGIDPAWSTTGATSPASNVAGGTGAITGTSASTSSLPPYYEVAFIIKT